MVFYKAPLDLIECGHRHPGRVATKTFAHHIVALADDVIHTYTPAAELEGIRQCIKHLVVRLKWKLGFGFLPLVTHRYRDTSFGVVGREYMLVDSIVLTTLVYRSPLDEEETDLRLIMLAEFIQGIEWACEAAMGTSRLDDTTAFPTLAAEKIAKYVEGSHA